MGVRTEYTTTLYCDGWRKNCRRTIKQSGSAATLTRRVAYRMGWRRRPYQDIQIDLCAECNARYDADPPERGVSHGGRPVIGEKP